MRGASDFFNTPNTLKMANAIERNNIEEIKELSKILDINYQGKDDMSFLLWSFLKHQHTAMDTLLKLGANPNISIGDTYLLAYIASNYDITWLKLLDSYNVNLNQKRKTGTPIMFETIIADKWENLLYFLDHGADINLRDHAGYSAIMRLADLGEYEHVFELIKRGADLKKTSPYGYSLASSVKVSVPQKGTNEYMYRKKVIEVLKKEGIFTSPLQAPLKK